MPWAVLLDTLKDVACNSTDFQRIEKGGESGSPP